MSRTIRPCHPLSSSAVRTTILLPANVTFSIKREIGHLCHDENRPSKHGAAQAQASMPPPPAAETSTQCMSLPSLFMTYIPFLFVAIADLFVWLCNLDANGLCQRIQQQLHL